MSIKAAFVAVKDWVVRSWRWLRWVLVAAAAVVLWVKLRKRVSHMVSVVRRPASWSKIPGVTDHVVVKNPRDGKPEAVKLPQGVTADEVVSVGITKGTEDYAIELQHTPTNRRGNPAPGGSLDLSL